MEGGFLRGRQKGWNGIELFEFTSNFSCFHFHGEPVGLTREELFSLAPYLPSLSPDHRRVEKSPSIPRCLANSWRGQSDFTLFVSSG